MQQLILILITKIMNKLNKVHPKVITRAQSKENFIKRDNK